MSGTTTPPVPPEPAVARDAHWASKLARLRARQLPEQVLQLCDDAATQKRLDQAKLNLARLRMADAETGGEQTELEAAQAELVAAQAAFDEVSDRLVFRALPRPVLDGLIRQNPPTEDQAESGDAWNPESFPPALVAAAYIERDEDGQVVEGLTVEDAQGLLDSWPIAEANALFAAAWQAQQINRSTVTELGKG
ncbi:hypothetical protein [Streptomyces sp. H34-S4]|uniref:hypothetical protein n=1 Tax=Streptomyces sp. H34-S4 TaxID=2996463 RepID=UPI00226D6E1E|nr:hypothetical protein [Streptomyces sp. H34-S4]MCY0938850.1 hypothetical protein [Streptomyces sp. H34-S4]